MARSLNSIVAVSQNMGIGKDGRLPWPPLRYRGLPPPRPPRPLYSPQRAPRRAATGGRGGPTRSALGAVVFKGMLCEAGKRRRGGNGAVGLFFAWVLSHAMATGYRSCSHSWGTKVPLRPWHQPGPVQPPLPGNTPVMIGSGFC